MVISRKSTGYLQKSKKWSLAHPAGFEPPTFRFEVHLSKSLPFLCHIRIENNGKWWNTFEYRIALKGLLQLFLFIPQ
jgi:hypothetical protein